MHTKSEEHDTDGDDRGLSVAVVMVVPVAVMGWHVLCAVICESVFERASWKLGQEKTKREEMRGHAYLDRHVQQGHRLDKRHYEPRKKRERK
jgi:hypothetical protein